MTFPKQQITATQPETNERKNAFAGPARSHFFVPPSLRSWVEVDPGAMRENLAAIRRCIGTGPDVLAVIKANAYGHGAERTAREIADAVSLFGVANLPEARSVLSAGTGRPIMLLSPCLPAERQEAVALGLIVTVSGAEEASGFAACGAARVNFKVDSGMGRVGFCGDRVAEELARTAACVEVHSISTHLPSSDEDEPFTLSQLQGFSRLCETLRRIVPGAKIHSLNSAGILRFPNYAADVVRAGILLYGCSPLPEFQQDFVPALAWKTKVTLVKDLPEGTGVSYGRTHITQRPTRAAVLAVGYADGYPRHLSSKGASVLICGCRCPLLGRVTMDQIVVDATDAENVAPGDEAVLIGTQGKEEITAQELAARAETIPWEIFTGINGRVSRIFPDRMEGRSTESVLLTSVNTDNPCDLDGHDQGIFI